MEKREEIIVELLEAEKKVGHFLDVRAYDGSNTLILAKLGWSGVCIESSPLLVPALLKLHGGSERITLVSAAVLPKNAFAEIWEEAAFVRITIFGVTFADIFGQFGTMFNFINLKGISTDMFLRLPLQSLEQCKVLCVEHNGKLAEVQSQAGHFGFQYVWHNGQNIILSR